MKKYICILLVVILAIGVNGTGVNAKDNNNNVCVSKGFTLEELENRNGNLYVEVLTGEVVDHLQNGSLETGDYISYKSVEGTKAGDTIYTILVYNPDSNYIDDIILRYDIIK